MRMNADVLVLIESCEAAGLAFATQDHTSNGKMEVIAACAYPDGVYPYPRYVSFSRALAAELRDKAVTGNLFTTADLYNGLL